jgi:hypothetical protein
MEDELKILHNFAPLFKGANDMKESSAMESMNGREQIRYLKDLDKICYER